MAPRPASRIAGIVGGVFLITAGWFVAHSIGKPMRDQASASTAWPTTEGRIVASRIKRTKNTGHGKAKYTADITYEYVLDGGVFTGHRIWIGDDYSSSDASAFRAAVARYPAGTSVVVHYDPIRPAESVLEPGPTWSGSALYYLGMALMALGGIILVSRPGTRSPPHDDTSDPA